MSEAALLETIKPEADEAFLNALVGLDRFSPEATSSAESLAEATAGAHTIGVRSGGIPDGYIGMNPDLQQIGFFCAGVKVDLQAANEAGIPLFNATDENTRAVAEFVKATVLNGARMITGHNQSMQDGIWSKSDNGAQEILGKTIAIKGWGKIGSQAGVMLGNVGMKVIYHDPYTKLPGYGAEKVGSFEELLKRADFLSLHVPAHPDTDDMMNADTFARMKDTAYLINASRGSAIVDQDLVDAVTSGTIRGAHIDVYREEYEKGLAKGDAFDHPFRGVEGITLTPHIAGSTPEAQIAVAKSVSAKLVEFLLTGTTMGAVNVPNLSLAPVAEGRTRLLNIHRNKPGVMAELTSLLTSLGVNIGRTQQDANKELGYVAFDVEGEIPDQTINAISSQEFSRRTRVIKSTA